MTSGADIPRWRQRLEEFEDALTLFDAAQLAEAPPFRPIEGLREWYRLLGDRATSLRAVP